MADYSNVAPPSSNAGGGMNDAFKDALQRARQVSLIIECINVPHFEVLTCKTCLKRSGAVELIC